MARPMSGIVPQLVCVHLDPKFSGKKSFGGRVIVRKLRFVMLSFYLYLLSAL